MLRQRRKKKDREANHRQSEFPVGSEQDEDPSHGDRGDHPVGERSERNRHEPIVLGTPTAD